MAEHPRRATGTTVLAAAVMVVLLWLVLYPNLFVLGDSVAHFGRGCPRRVTT